MRVKECSFTKNEDYSTEIRDRAETVLILSEQIVRIQKLIAEVKKESGELRKLFLTEEERVNMRKSVGFFDSRMQAMAFFTLRNMESYLTDGWKSLYEIENSSEGGLSDENASLRSKNL